jgi:hypothetical protein
LYNGKNAKISQSGGSMSKIRKCPICGGDVIGDYCFSCGYELPKEDEIAASNNPEPKRSYDDQNYAEHGNDRRNMGVQAHSNVGANAQSRADYPGGTADYQQNGNRNTAHRDGEWHSGGGTREPIYGENRAQPGTSSDAGFVEAPRYNNTNSNSYNQPNSSNYAYTDTADPSDYPEIRVIGEGTSSHNHSYGENRQYRYNDNVYNDGVYQDGQPRQSRFSRFVARYAQMRFTEKMRHYWWYILLTVFIPGNQIIPFLVGLITLLSHRDRDAKRFGWEQIILSVIGFIALLGFL